MASTTGPISGSMVGNSPHRTTLLAPGAPITSISPKPRWWEKQRAGGASSLAHRNRPRPSPLSIGTRRLPTKIWGYGAELKFPAVVRWHCGIPRVISKVDSPENQSAHLTVTGLLKNATQKPVKGLLQGRIEKIAFSQEVELGPGESKDVIFTPRELLGIESEPAAAMVAGTDGHSRISTSSRWSF